LSTVRLDLLNVGDARRGGPALVPGQGIMTLAVAVDYMSAKDRQCRDRGLAKEGEVTVVVINNRNWLTAGGVGPDIGPHVLVKEATRRGHG